LKIYIATKFENHPRAQEVAKNLEDAGHTITYKWWVSDEPSAEQAWLDYTGVIFADAVVLIVEKNLPYSGALTEFGIALGRGIPVYIMGNALDIEPKKGPRANIFTMLKPEVFKIHRGIETLLQATHTTA